MRYLILRSFFISFNCCGLHAILIHLCLCSTILFFLRICKLPIHVCLFFSPSNPTILRSAQIHKQALMDDIIVIKD